MSRPRCGNRRRVPTTESYEKQTATCLRDPELSRFEHQGNARSIRSANVVSESLKVLTDQCLNAALLVGRQMRNILHNEARGLENLDKP